MAILHLHNPICMTYKIYGKGFRLHIKTSPVAAPKAPRSYSYSFPDSRGLNGLKRFFNPRTLDR